MATTNEYLLEALKAMTEWQATKRLPWPLPQGCTTGPELVRHCQDVIDQADAERAADLKGA